MEKHLSYNFHIWKNVYHRDFIQFSVRMELYDKKFLIYENCMIRSFGHPGTMVTAQPYGAISKIQQNGSKSRKTEKWVVSKLFL